MLEQLSFHNRWAQITSWDLSFYKILTLMAFIVITAAHCIAIMQDLKVGL